jgi:exosome complex exonuclease RRP6
LIGPALGRHFENEEKLKVFHGANSDMIWLQRDFGIYVVNMFDTGQAARTLELPSFGLAYLLKQYCGIKAEKKYQLADWRLRPLSREMINYARSDTHSLLYVHDRLKQELYAKGGVECIQSVFLKSRDVCLLTYEPQVITDLSYHEDLMKSANASSGGGSGHGNTLSRSAQQAQLSQEILKSPVAQAAMEALFKWRDDCARANDESLGFVMPRHLMLRLASEQPKVARDVVSTARGESSLVAKFSHVIADIIKSAVERGSPVNAAPSAGELFRREHEAAMLLVKEKDDKKDLKKSTDGGDEGGGGGGRAAPVEATDKHTDTTKKKTKKKAGGMMKMMMMMSTSDEDNDDDSDAHAKAAKDMADHIQTELVSNRQNVFPMYHSIAASGGYGDRRRDGEEIENKSAQKGKKRKSNDVLLKSIAERNKDKSKRIEIAGGVSLPAPIRTKTTQKLGFGSTHDSELMNDEDDEDEDGNGGMSIKEEAMKARAALRKRQKKAMMMSNGGGFSLNHDSDADSDAEEDERIQMEKEKQADFKRLTKGAKSHNEIVEQTQKTLGIKSVHAEILKGPDMLKKKTDHKRLDAIKGKKGFDGGEWIEPFGKTNLKSRAFPRAGNKQQSFK